MSEFNTGYVLACSNLVNLHGHTEMAADLLAQTGICWADILRMDLGEYDMKAMRKIREERSRHPFADGRKRRAASPSPEGGR